MFFQTTAESRDTRAQPGSPPSPSVVITITYLVLGPVTSAALTELGLPVAAEAAEFATHDPEPDPAELWTDVLLA